MPKSNEISKLKSKLSVLRKDHTKLEMELDILDRVGKALSSVFNLDDLLIMIMEKITEIMEADRSTLYLLDKEKNELWSKIAQGTKEIRLKVGQGLSGYVAQTGEIINIPDAYKDPRFNQATDKQTGYRTNSMLTIPMRNRDGEITGVIQVLNKKSGIFKKNDEEIGLILGTQISIAIENVRLYEYYLAQKEIELEMKIAAKTQASLLPRTSPEIENYDVSGFNIPAKDTGGDYYDFIKLNNGNWAFAIGDITGKGLPAALLMTTARAYIRALSSSNTSISELVAKLNQAMYEDTEPEKFLTLFYGVLNPIEKSFTFTNAGHDIPFWFKADSTIKNLTTNNLFVGSFPNIPYNEKKITLSKGDILILYTDGIIEARNENNNIFGEDRLTDIINNNKSLSSLDMLNKIYDVVKKFSGKCPQQDDITAIVIKVI